MPNFKKTAFSNISRSQFVLLLFLLVITSGCSNLVPNLAPSQTAKPIGFPPVATGTHQVESQIPLDLQEANVVAVTFVALENGKYRFDVTLQHDDEGEAPNFADFWQVEDLDGNILGKRVLTHSHSNEPFTRSETITIPDHISSIVVRGHDMNHDFGGQAMKVNILDGETESYLE